MSAFPYAWRISKYDPGLRDAQGHFQGDEWTFFAQIGRSFNGKPLTYKDYVAVESAYVHTIMRFLSDVGLDSLRISGLTAPSTTFIARRELQDILLRPEDLCDDSVIELDQLADVIRLNLRELTWCRLQEAGRFYLHFGWDYYVYIGSTSPSLVAIRRAEQDGLHVEAKASPYL